MLLGLLGLLVKIVHKIGAVSVYWGLIVIDIIKRYYRKEVDYIFPFHKYYGTYHGWNRIVEGNVKTDCQRVGNAQNEKVGNDAKSRLALCER